MERDIYTKLVGKISRVAEKVNALSEGSTEALEEITRPARADVSVLEYAIGLTEGIHFYTTNQNTEGNPTESSYAFIIYRASTGITIIGICLAGRAMYINASSNDGTSYGGWKQFSMEA